MPGLHGPTPLGSLSGPSKGMEQPVTDTINRPDPTHTFKYGQDLPDLDAEMRYLVESTAGHRTEPMTAEQCLTYLGIVPEVTSFEEEDDREDTEWNIWPC